MAIAPDLLNLLRGLALGFGTVGLGLGQIGGAERAILVLHILAGVAVLQGLAGAPAHVRIADAIGGGQLGPASLLQVKAFARIRVHAGGAAGTAGGMDRPAHDFGVGGAAHGFLQVVEHLLAAKDPENAGLHGPGVSQFLQRFEHAGGGGVELFGAGRALLERLRQALHSGLSLGGQLAGRSDLGAHVPHGVGQRVGGADGDGSAQGLDEDFLQGLRAPHGHVGGVLHAGQLLGKLPEGGVGLLIKPGGVQAQPCDGFGGFGHKFLQPGFFRLGGGDDAQALDHG